MVLVSPSSAMCKASIRYDLNQIPHDYMVEMRNRFKGLDLIDTVPDELWTLCHCTGDWDQDHRQENEMQESKRAL